MMMARSVARGTATLDQCVVSTLQTENVSTQAGKRLMPIKIPISHPGQVRHAPSQSAATLSWLSSHRDNWCRCPIHAALRPIRLVGRRFIAPNCGLGMLWRRAEAAPYTAP